MLRRADTAFSEVNSYRWRLITGLIFGYLHATTQKTKAVKAMGI
jgi:hypothetical protein